MENIDKGFDSIGRLKTLLEISEDKKRTVKSVEYLNPDGPSRIDRYTIRHLNEDGSGDYETYDSFGRIVEDGEYLEGSVVSQKREYDFNSGTRKYQVTLYTHGGSENPVPVNHFLLKEAERPKLDFQAEFAEFFPKGETGLERVQAEAGRMGLNTAAEVYQARTEGRGSVEADDRTFEKSEKTQPKDSETPDGGLDEGAHQRHMIY